MAESKHAGAPITTIHTFQVRSVPVWGAEASYCAKTDATSIGQVQHSVLQSVVAMPNSTVAAGTETGAIQLHCIDRDSIKLNHVLHGCS